MRSADAVGLGAASLLIGGTRLAVDGVRAGGDTSLYTKGVGVRPGYTGYEALVWVSQHAGAGTFGVVVLQLVLAAIGTAAVYAIARDLGGRRAGLIAGGIALVAPFIELGPGRWDLHVLTDSAYGWGIVVSVWATHRAAVIRRPWSFAGAVTVLLAAAAIRPEGVVLVPISATYWLARLDAGRRRRAAVVGGAIALALLASVAAPSIRRGLDAAVGTGRVERGEVIGGFASWHIPARGPVSYAALAGARVGTELTHARPFYSPAHNAIALAVLVPLYALAVVGFRRSRDRPLARLLAVLIAGHIAVVAVTFADWDGRFLDHVLPLVIALAGCGAEALLSRRFAWRRA